VALALSGFSITANIVRRKARPPSNIAVIGACRNFIQRDEFEPAVETN
jgi:hypothetical protein